MDLMCSVSVEEETEKKNLWLQKYAHLLTKLLN